MSPFPPAPIEVRVDLSLLPHARARVVFREIPARTGVDRVPERPSVPANGTEVLDNGGTTWAAVELNAQRASQALSVAVTHLSGAVLLAASDPAACAHQIRKGVAHALLALLLLARQHAAQGASQPREDDR